jgi:hypothetical protein
MIISPYSTFNVSLLVQNPRTQKDFEYMSMGQNEVEGIAGIDGQEEKI